VPISPTRFTSPAVRQRSRAPHGPGLRGAAVSAVALSLAALSGCGSSGANAQSRTTPLASSNSTATSPAPSPTQSPTARQQAVSAAIAQVRRYERTLDDLAIDPHLSLDRLYRVSTQPDVDDEIAYLNHFRIARERQFGRVRLLDTAADSVDLTNRPHARKPVYPTVTITTCLRVSQRGRSTRRASRLRRSHASPTS
jgi:hypothetical protein